MPCRGQVLNYHFSYIAAIGAIEQWSSLLSRPADLPTQSMTSTGFITSPPAMSAMAVLTASRG